MKKAQRKLFEKQLRSAKGESNRAASFKATADALYPFLPESAQIAETTIGLNRQDGNWFRWNNRLAKDIAKKYPDVKTLRHHSHEGVYFVGFENLFTDVSRGVDNSDHVAIHRRACVITAQAIMCDIFNLTWSRAIQFAVSGVPPIPYKEGDAPEILVPWHEFVMRRMRDMEKLDVKLLQKMRRFTNEPTAQKRIHARSIDSHLLRDRVIDELENCSLPPELLEKELQQSFNPCYGSGYGGNLPKFLEYFRHKRDFEGDLAIAKAAANFVVRRVLEAAGGKIEPYSVERTFAWLFKKTNGRTEVGGRFHCKQERLGPDGVKRVLEDAKNITNLTTRLPSELGNRFVPAKNKYAEGGGDLREKYRIDGHSPKDRNTFAVYKAKQIKDLSFIYPLQKVMSSMQWFVALLGHDATFNVSDSNNQIAMEIYIALRQLDSWGASWDFSSHDAYLDIILKLLYGQEEFSDFGLLPQLFPETPKEEWAWLYEASSQGSCFIEGGLAFVDYGCVRGVSSGEGFTNGGESLGGAVLLIDSLINHVKRHVGDVVYRLIEVDGFLDRLVDSTVMLLMGDDTASITSHPDFVGAINYGLDELGLPPLALDSVRAITPEEAASDFRCYGTNPSTDRRKISYFERGATRRMLDFTAHQCFVTFVDGEVREHFHGYYCFLRSLASYVFAENRSPQENLIGYAKLNDRKLNLDDLFNADVLGFFAVLQYSILSNLYLNPTRMMDAVLPIVLEQVPHYGGLVTLARSPEAAEKHLKNMRVREQLRGQSLSQSPVFKSMLHAYGELLKRDEHRHEVATLLEWLDYCVVSGDIALDDYAFMKGYSAAACDWDGIYALIPEDNNPASNNKRASEKKAIDEELSEIAEAFEGSMLDSVYLQYAKVKRSK